MASIQLRKISKQFGVVKVLNDIDLQIEDGEFVVFVGPSGCGKSTLLRIISGLDHPSDGEIFMGEDKCNAWSTKARNVAMVFQSYALYPHMTVARNIGYSLKLDGLSKAAIAIRVEGIADMLGIRELLERKPSQLSGGQRQRVAMGRALVRQPNVFLLDEPLSNLDAALRSLMRVELSSLHQRMNTTTIYVTHDQIEAMTLADRIVVMNKGGIEQVGTPMEVFNCPASTFVAGFIGAPKINFIQGPLALRYDAYTIGIRPEHLHPSMDAKAWPVQVVLVERLGTDTVVHVKSDLTGELAIRAAGQFEIDVGDDIGLVADEAHIHLFNKNGQRLRSAAVAKCS